MKEQVEEDGMGGTCSSNGANRNAYRKARGREMTKEDLHTDKWIIKMDLGEVEWSGVDWVALAENRDKWKFLVNVGQLLFSLQWLVSSFVVMLSVAHIIYEKQWPNLNLKWH
jgi:hypothetical protein